MSIRPVPTAPRRVLKTGAAALALVVAQTACAPYHANGVAHAPAAEIVYVHKAPPPPRVVPRPPRPIAHAVWVGGHWGWTGVRYVWVDGYWDRAPRGKVWVSGHWTHTPRGWRWVSGRWRR